MLTLGLCLEYETFIRGVFCPNLFVCVYVLVCVCVCPLFLKKKIIASGPLGPPVIFSNNIVHTININIFPNQNENFLGPKILQRPKVNLLRTHFSTLQVWLAISSLRKLLLPFRKTKNYPLLYSTNYLTVMEEVNVGPPIYFYEIHLLILVICLVFLATSVIRSGQGR